MLITGFLREGKVTCMMDDEPKSLFRQKALDKLARVETLDDRIVIVSTKSWLLLIGLYTLLFCFILWGFFGTIPVRVEGEGLLLYGNSHIYNASVTASNGGTIAHILVKPGFMVHKGQIIAELNQQALTQQIKVAAHYVKQLEAEQQVNEAKAQQSIAAYNSHSEDQIQQLNKNIQQTTVMLNANKNMLDMRQKLFEEGVEDKASVVEALQTYQETKNEINNTLQQISQSRKDELDFSAQWNQHLQQSQQQLEDKQKEFADLWQQYSIGKYVRSPVAGQVISILVSLGDFVGVGKAVANIVPKGKGIEALVYVSSDEAKRIKSGMKAIVYPSTVQKNEYGGIYGSVTNVSSYPAHPNSMLSLLQDKDLVNRFNRLGPAFSVTITLKQDPSTYSGFAWSSSLGPHQSITPGTLVTARVTIEERRPMSLLFPALRNLIEEN